ncbi:TonB-linked outer membrane protein, SusC/RagA family [Bacteroidales bacterium 6E]|nr:TonB-linked outer membrane protein, SusC/RagA family [Bacteroidales bacterium 6E]
MKRELTCCGFIPWRKQFVRKMKLTVLLLTFAILSGFASESYSQAARLTLNMEKTTIRDVLKEIESQSEFRFFYSGEINVEKTANVSVQNKNVMETLDQVFNGTDIRYEIYGRQIALLAKQETALPAAMQQVRVVTGKVTDRSGAALPGVTVVVKGTTTGTITDPDGQYSLGSIQSGSVLVFSFIGMRTQEITLGNQLNINVVMEDATFGVDEVIVTGVASGTPKSKIGFAIEKIGSKSLQQVPAVDAGSAIQGKVAGVRITKTSGAPGSGSDIQLRGVKTIFGSSNPLIIIDGVQTELGLSDVNAEDIESIEVLKGAAASSLYGSRAANGVVSIMTKRGSSVSAGEVVVDYRIESGKSFIGFVPSKSLATNRIIQNGAVTNAVDPDRVMDNLYPKVYDHLDQFFNPGGYTTNYLAVKGNSTDSKMSVYASMQSTREQGIVQMVDGNTRNNFKVNMDYQISEKWTLTTSNLFSQSKSDDRAAGAFSRLLDSDPDADLLTPNADGSPYKININKIKSTSANPLYEIANTINKSNSQKLISYTGLRFFPVDYLLFEGSYGTTRTTGEGFSLSPKGKLRTDLTEDNGYISRSQWNAKEEIVTIEGSFFKKFGDFNTRLKAQYLYESSVNSNLWAGGNDLGVRGFGVTSVNLSANQSTSSAIYKSIAYNYASIAAVDYKDKYIVDALIRRDASSLFGADVRWQTFYRVSGAWRINEDLNLKGVEEWKLRASYGVAGLRPPFEAQYEVFSLTNGVAGNMETLGNTNLKPSFSKELEVGTDIYFLNRFNFSFSYSDAKNTDQILKVPISPLSGAAFQWQNAGTIKSTAFEASLGYNVIKRKDLTWDVTFLFDRIRQKITKLNATPYMLNGTRFRIEEGIDFGVLYLDKFARSLGDVENQVPAGRTVDEWFVVNNQGFVVERASIGTINEKPVKIKDDKGNIAALPAANFNPDFNMNFTSTLSWKNLTVYALATWQQGGQVYNHSVRYTTEPKLLDQSGLPWNAVKPMGYYENNGQTGGILGWDNDVLAFDASFLKLRELSLSYDIKPASMEKYLSNIRLSVIGRNLLTLTRYPGFDPETGRNEPSKGVDSNAFRFDSNDSYPIYRMFSGSLAITF